MRPILGPLFALLVLASAAAKPAKPCVRLRVSPDRGFAPLVVTTQATVIDPRHELWCGDVAWTWGNDGGSSETIDCDAYEPNDQLPERWSTVPRQHTFHRPGQHLVIVTVRRAGVSVTRAVRVDVLGPAGLSDLAEVR